MVEAVLLEWEGVLADTRRLRRDALRRAMAAEGVAHTLADDDEQVRGLGVRGAVGVVLRHMGSSDATLAELLEMRARREFAAMMAQGLVLADGAVKFVERLQSRARVLLVSRASRDECTGLLRLAGLEHAVSAVVCADDVAEAAPCVPLYRHALARVARYPGGAAGGAVAIVDRRPAIRAAREAGTRVIVVGAPAYEAMDADMAVDRLDAVCLDAESFEPNAALRVREA